MYRNILVAVDQTGLGSRVLAHAAELAEALNAKLTVLCVAPDIPPFAQIAAVDLDRLERDVVNEAEKVIEAAREQLSQDLSVVTIVRQGHPGTQIVAQIETGDHDLVVLGSRGRGRLASGILGSVVGDVHFATHVPMLVVHP